MEDFNIMVRWMEDHNMHLCLNYMPTHGRGNVIDYIFVSSEYAEHSITTTVVLGTSLNHNIIFAELNRYTPTGTWTILKDLYRFGVFI